MASEDVFANINSTDPALGLRAVGALHRLAEQVQHNTSNLRVSAVGRGNKSDDALGVSRQAVHSKYGKRGKNVERFADTARTIVVQGVEEARDRGDRRVGTDHLLVALLTDRDTAELLGTQRGCGARGGPRARPASTGRGRHRDAGAAFAGRTP